MDDYLSSDDAKQLIRLCQAGQLYDVEEWIHAGRSLQLPRELKKTALGVAVSTGFHSLVELLLRHEDSQQVKNDTLRQAVQLRRPELVELAVKYGAEAASVSFLDALMTADRGIVALLLEKGADPVADFPFAYAFHELRAKTTLGTYLDCRRSRPELADQLQQQADMALRQFCHDGNLKWVSLLMWAGADPRSTGPTIEYPDDPDMFTTALEEASTCGHLEVLKRLKPDRERDDLANLLQHAAFFAHRDVMAYLFSLGANPNDRPDGGSTALDKCIRHLGWEDLDRVLYGYGPQQTPAYKVSKTREAIRLLIEHSAVWKPDGSSLNDVRRTLYKIDPEVTVEFAHLLAVHRACEDDTLRGLLRTDRMQQHIASCERQMSRLGLTLDGRRRSELPKEERTLTLSAHVLARYDREKLYNEVWSEATQKVAARYGVSDVALTKVCRQLNIPKPPRGYWAKKAARQPLPRRPKLLPLGSVKVRR
jgi:ankyrin repeat protein